MTFAEKIIKLRKLLGNISQLKLAQLLKTTQSTVSSWECGITACREYSLVKLEKLSEKKGIKINWRK